MDVPTPKQTTKADRTKDFNQNKKQYTDAKSALANKHTNTPVSTGQGKK